jgi:uncharacterized protein YjeT (DUF2065 family)
MNDSQCRKLGAVSALIQGVLTALLPQLSVRLIKRMIGMNFENADGLEVKPGYVRQLRAFGIGLAVAGAAGLVLERAAKADDDETADED